MGYTHYWHQDRGPANAEQWAAIVADFQRLLKHSPVHVQREEDRSAPPEITDEHIIFNGVGADAHETMVLSRDSAGFNFCKTARKDYDLLVTALLVLANHHAFGVWDISSDGDAGEWQPALDLLHHVGAPQRYQMPALD